MMETNDDDLEVAAVLAQGLTQGLDSVHVLKSNVAEQPNSSLRVSSSMLTSNSQGNTTTNTPTKKLETLHQLAARGELILIQELALDDCQINGADEHSLTPLMWAAMYGQTDVLSYLLQVGARVNMYNQGGTTSLMLACYHGNPGVVRLLLDEDADINQVDVEGNSALLYTVFGDQVECIRLLLESGADITQKNIQNITAMDAAVKLHHKNVQKCLEMYLMKCLTGS